MFMARLNLLQVIQAGHFKMYQHTAYHLSWIECRNRLGTFHFQMQISTDKSENP